MKALLIITAALAFAVIVLVVWCLCAAQNDDLEDWSDENEHFHP